jgi:hypothetical protein
MFPLLALLGAPAAAQGLPVAAPQEIVAAAQSCAAATGPSGVDQPKLIADGWHRASITSDGKPVENAGLIFGKGDLLLRLSDASAKICFISGRIQDAATLGDVAYAMDKGLGVSGAAKAGESNTYYWFPPNHIVQLQLTGKPDAPAVRVAVGYHPLETK